jgi:hypothetical protein
VLPFYIDDIFHLWGSNLIIEHLFKKHPDCPEDALRPLLFANMTRHDHHWRDSKILATLETMTGCCGGARITLEHLAYVDDHWGPLEGFRDSFQKGIMVAVHLPRTQGFVEGSAGGAGGRLPRHS